MSPLRNYSSVTHASTNSWKRIKRSWCIYNYKYTFASISQAFALSLIPANSARPFKRLSLSCQKLFCQIRRFYARLLTLLSTRMRCLLALHRLMPTTWVLAWRKSRMVQWPISSRLLGSICTLTLRTRRRKAQGFGLGFLDFSPQRRLLLNSRKLEKRQREIERMTMRKILHAA